MDIQDPFAQVLRRFRKAHKMAQEDFLDVCSQSYISQLERGLNKPTLPMIDELAAKMGVHPIALLLKTYEAKWPNLSLEEQLEIALADVRNITQLEKLSPSYVPSNPIMPSTEIK